MFLLKINNIGPNLYQDKHQECEKFETSGMFQQVTGLPRLHISLSLV